MLGTYSTGGGGILELVILNGCSSLSLGRMVARAGVPNVVCWKTRVQDKAAKAFALAFFREDARETCRRARRSDAVLSVELADTSRLVPRDQDQCDTLRAAGPDVPVDEGHTPETASDAAGVPVLLCDGEVEIVGDTISDEVSGRDASGAARVVEAAENDARRARLEAAEVRQAAEREVALLRETVARLQAETTARAPTAPEIERRRRAVCVVGALGVSGGGLSDAWHWLLCRQIAQHLLHVCTFMSPRRVTVPTTTLCTASLSAFSPQTPSAEQGEVEWVGRAGASHFSRHSLPHDLGGGNGGPDLVFLQFNQQLDGTQLPSPIPAHLAVAALPLGRVTICVPVLSSRSSGLAPARPRASQCA